MKIKPSNYILEKYPITGQTLMRRLVPAVIANGDIIQSERGETYEILGASMYCENPLDRVSFEKNRKINYPFIICEFLQLVTGNTSLAAVMKFIKGYDAYSSDGVNVDGAYGGRNFIVKDTEGKSQLEQVIAILRKTPESRRAVMTLYDSMDLFGAGGKNTPCTLTYQFLIRDGKLHLICSMRSNDVHYGLSNDLAVNTLLQEYVADMLGVEVGTYFHNVGSLHVYKEIHEKFIARKEIKERHWPSLLPRMAGAFASGDDVHHLMEYIEKFDTVEGDNAYFRLTTDYARDWANMIAAYLYRHDSTPVNSVQSYRWIVDETHRKLMRMWLPVENVARLSGKKDF